MSPTLIAIIAVVVCSAVVGFATYVVMQRATGQALADALAAMDGKAEQQRQEAMRLATESIREKGDLLLGEKAKQLDEEFRKYQKDLKEVLEQNAKQFGGFSEAVGKLSRGTEELRKVLFNPSKRGQWGERLAEDILRWAGLLEGKNYTKQEQIEGGGKPDYKIDMPPDRTLFMDAKFPLEQYAAYVNAQDEAAQKVAKDAFIAAVKGHISALAKRDYITKADANTIDYVLMFVPNESISAFVNEADPTLIDKALEHQVVLCTPLTLYAFLVVIRQATESFHTQKGAVEIMRRINLFGKEWEKYTAEISKVEKQFEGLLDTLQSINVGGTRYKKLNVQVREIENLRKKAGVPDLTSDEMLALQAGDDGEIIEGEYVEDDDPTMFGR